MAVVSGILLSSVLEFIVFPYKILKKKEFFTSFNVNTNDTPYIWS